MSKQIKQMQMDSMKAALKDVRDLVLLSATGVNAITENQLRLQLRKKNIYMHMVKNSLARRVFSDLGLQTKSPWEGPTLMAWGADSLSDLSKALEPIVKKNEKTLKVKCAVAEGQEITFKQALDMPTRAGAIGTIVAMVIGPASQIAGQIIGPASQIAGQIKTLSEKKPEEAAAPPA
ncbi:MAG: 50S ribosomal protein L10 [Gemmataceae bacterium]|nr:50S ribosomal protein L10 [Gemmataceae bacterium]